MASNVTDGDNITLGKTGGSGDNPFGIDGSNTGSSGGSRRSWGSRRGNDGGGRTLGGNRSTTGTGTGTAGKETGRVQSPAKNPRVKGSKKGIILPWEWVSVGLQNLSVVFAKNVRPVRMSDGGFLWAIDKEEGEQLAKAIVPLGKYIPIDLPEGSSELLKDLKPVIDALAVIVGQRLAVEQMILAANRPVPSNNGTTTQTIPTMPVAPAPPQQEPVTITNIGDHGYDVSRDRRGTLGL